MPRYRYTFTRTNGEPMHLQFTVNEAALAEHLARTMAQQGKIKKAIAGGAIVATVTA